MVGIASFTIKLSLSLDAELEGVTAHDVPGSCAALIGMDLLNERKGILGPASITLAGGSGGREIHFKLIS